MVWDAVRFCKDFKIPYVPAGMSVKVTSGRIGVCCPNPQCKHNRDPDFGSFHLRNGYYTCWSCGAHKLERVIGWFLHIRKAEIEEIIWHYKGTSSSSDVLEYKKKKAGQVSKVEIPGGKLKRSHRDYLEFTRGFDPDYLIKKYNLTAVGNKTTSRLENNYKNRIIIPIIDRSGRVISFQGRDITEKARIRYKGCEIANSIVNYKHTLYGLPFANDKQCAIVEGVIDQWAMGNGFLCTFGTATTAYQIREMASFDRIFILFDPEEEAQKSAQKIATKLASLNKQVEIIETDTDFDPDEMSDTDRKYIRRELGFL